MTEYKKAVVVTKGNTLIFEVGKENVVRIIRNAYSPEPHCGVELLEIFYADRSLRVFNLAYTPEIYIEPNI